jgi:site-specific DNA recombinase
LNVLLSFAQFERELASERVRDKVAASRKKGKWTGGTVPLGYDSKDKKLVINKTEAETVRTIFRLYLELKSFGKLVAELDRRKIVTKRRNTKVAKYNGGIPFTYGPLAYFLKNRIYIGEMHHDGKWFKGEHEAILGRPTFERVQDVLKSNRITRRIKHSESGALLRGKLFDDKGNAMSASFSAKNGIRYRFYVSTALRGRKHQAGSITRVSAPEVERTIEDALLRKLEEQGASQKLSGIRSNAHPSRRTVLLLRLVRPAPKARPQKPSRSPGPRKRQITTPDRHRHLIASPTRSCCKHLFARTPGCLSLQMIAALPSKSWPAKPTFIQK